MSKPSLIKPNALFAKNKKATVNLKVQSYESAEDLNNFFISILKDDHEVKSDVVLSSKDSRHQDGATPLLDCRFKVNLHLQKYSTSKFNRKVLGVRVVSQNTGKIFEQSEICLHDIISPSASQGQANQSINLSENGKIMVSIEWKTENPNQKLDAGKSLFQIKESSTDEVLSPSDGIRVLYEQREAYEHPRSKTIDDNITYTNMICNEKPEADSGVLALEFAALETT